MLVVPLIALGAYLLGSIPTGYLVAQARGVDIRGVGSGNIGATNVSRTLGKSLGALVLGVDGLKGLTAVLWLAGPLATRLWPAGAPAGDIEVAKLVGGMAAILGHDYTFWLRFKGGKGIATTAGVLLALVPRVLLVVLGVWIIVFTLSRYVSLASLSAAVALPFVTWMLTALPLVTAAAGGMGALAIWKHHANIRRLLTGTEHRFGAKPSTNVPPPTA